MFQRSGEGQENKSDSINSITHKWKKRIKKDKTDDTNNQSKSKWKRCKKVLKHESKSVDDELDSPHESLTVKMYMLL